MRDAQAAQVVGLRRHVELSLLTSRAPRVDATRNSASQRKRCIALRAIIALSLRKVGINPPKIYGLVRVGFLKKEKDRLILCMKKVKLGKTNITLIVAL